MARGLLYTPLSDQTDLPGSKIFEKEIVMPPTITITLDEKGNAKVSDLPQGVFYSRFAAPPDAQIRDVISINDGGLYTLQVIGPNVKNPSATAPVEVLGLQPTQVSFLVDASELPLLQEYGTASCQVGEGFDYTLGVIVNPLNLRIPVAVDITGEIAVDQADMPVGVHFNHDQHWFVVRGAGDYTFAFSLPAHGGVIFKDVTFDNPPEMIDYKISDDNLTFWVYNYYLKTNPATLAAPFTFVLSSQAPGSTGDITVDPTIINNPINQGGSGGSDYGREPRHELVGALAE
jgi:hypothetical protein